MEGNLGCWDISVSESGEEVSVNLNQIMLPALNLAESVNFYKALGFVEIVSNPPDYSRFECPDGGATFSLHLVNSASTSNDTVVYFECEELDRLYEKLTQQGIVFDSAPINQRWLWREAYLRDPSGNRLCLYLAGKNRRYPPWRLEKHTSTE